MSKIIEAQSVHQWWHVLVWVDFIEISPTERASPYAVSRSSGAYFRPTALGRYRLRYLVDAIERATITNQNHE